MARNEVPADNWLPSYDDDSFFCEIPLTVLEHFNWSQPENGDLQRGEPLNDFRVDKLCLDQIQLEDDGKEYWNLRDACDICGG